MHKTENQSDRFVELLYNLRSTTFSESVILQAKKCLVDHIGVTLAGAKMIREKGSSILDFYGNKDGDITVIGFDQKSSIESAVFVNGLSSHIAELDDGVRLGAIHPGSPLFSVLLPVAEKEEVNAKDLILGIITGYEASVRIAIAVQPSHYNRGYHPTSTCGSIGAALGIAAMLGYSKPQMKDTLSAATISASGTLKVIEDHSELKPFNAGRAAVNAFLASSIAKAGFRGPDDSLTGRTGLLSMIADQYDPTQFSRKRDEQYCIEKVYFKPYAACRHAHPSIEAALKLKSKYDIKTDNIKSIKTRTYQGVIGKHDHSDIYGVPSAKMSIPYSIAVVLYTGKAGIEQFTTKFVENSEIISLTKKIETIPDSEITKNVPYKRSAIVEIHTKDGNKFIEKVDYPKGEPENPLSMEEVESKFITLSEYGNKSRKVSREILDIVWDLENNLGGLFQRL